MRPLQGLDRRLFVDTENNRLGRRIDIEADHISGFRHKLRVIALAPGLAGDKIDIVLAQEAPDILNVNVAQCLGQQRTRPSGIARRRRLIQKRQNALVRDLAVDRLLARPRSVLQPSEAVVGKAPPPVADNARLNAHLLGDRTGAMAVSRQQHYSRPLHVALRRSRCTAASLKHLPYLRLEPNFSCFGNHPRLKSRLTREEKWVLGRRATHLAPLTQGETASHLKPQLRGELCWQPPGAAATVRHAAPASSAREAPPSVAAPRPLPAQRGCQWPLGDRRPFALCGKPVVKPGGPYCAGHTRIAWARGR